MPQLLATTGLKSWTLPFWASDFTVALLVVAQRFALLTSRLFLPPFISRTNFVTGASGTDSKVVRMPPLTESIRPASSISIWPWRSATRSGSLWLEERR